MRSEARESEPIKTLLKDEGGSHSYSILAFTVLFFNKTRVFWAISEEKFYLPDNLIFCCKIALLVCALLSIFFWDEHNAVISLKPLQFPSE